MPYTRPDIDEALLNFRLILTFGGPSELGGPLLLLPLGGPVYSIKVVTAWHCEGNSTAPTKLENINKSVNDKIIIVTAKYCDSYLSVSCSQIDYLPLLFPTVYN